MVIWWLWWWAVVWGFSVVRAAVSMRGLAAVGGQLQSSGQLRQTIALHSSPPYPCPSPPPCHLTAVTREAATLAEQMGVRIFTADINYHLFDQFTAYLKQVRCCGAGGVLGGRWWGVLCSVCAALRCALASCVILCGTIRPLRRNAGHTH